MSSKQPYTHPLVMVTGHLGLIAAFLCLLVCVGCCLYPPMAFAAPLFEIHQSSDHKQPTSLFDDTSIDDEVAAVSQAKNYGRMAPVTKDDDEKTKIATTLVCPAFCQTHDHLPINIHTSLPAGARSSTITCYFKERKSERILAQTSVTTTPQDQGAQVVQIVLDLSQLTLEPGSYQVIIEQLCPTPSELLQTTQRATLVILGDMPPQPVAIICQMEAPASVSVQGIAFDQQAAQLTQQALRLGELFDILEAHEHLHLTLATTWMTLEDMKALAQPPDMRIGSAVSGLDPEDQNSPSASSHSPDVLAGEQVRMTTLQHTIERMEKLVKDGKLEIICNGYADPHPALVDYLHDYSLITRQFQSPQTCDWRPALQVPIAQGSAPYAPPTSIDALRAYVQGQVGWIALPQDLTFRREATLERKLSNEETEALANTLVLPYRTQTMKAVRSGNSEELAEEIERISSRRQQEPAILCVSLTADATDQQVQGLKTLMGLIAHHPHLRTQMCNQLLTQTVAQSFETALDMVNNEQLHQQDSLDQDTSALDSTHDRSFASVKLVAANAYELTQALHSAGPNLTQSTQADLSFLKGLSAAYANNTEAQINQLELASERVRGLFSHISVSVQAQHLTGADGVVSVVVKNNSDEKLDLVIQPIPSSTLDLVDDQMKDGIPISSVAGENFKQIPVHLNSSGQELEQTPPTLTVNVLAKDHVISTQAIDVTSSRYDLTVYLFITIAVLIALIVVLRLRLRQFGMTEQADQEHLDETVQEIKEELIAEEPKVIDAIGDIEGHDEALERKVSSTELQELIDAGQTGSFERVGDATIPVASLTQTSSPAPGLDAVKTCQRTQDCGVMKDGENKPSSTPSEADGTPERLSGAPSETDSNPNAVGGAPGGSGGAPSGVSGTSSK